MKAKKTTKRTKKPTHRIDFHERVWSSRWDWRVVRVENGEVICHSNQGHENVKDAKGAVENFLKAVKAGAVEIVGGGEAKKKARRK